MTKRFPTSSWRISAATMATCALLAGTLSGCGTTPQVEAETQSAPVAEAEVAVEETPVEEPLAIPDATFTDRDGTLVNVAGEVVADDLPQYGSRDDDEDNSVVNLRPAGLASEGRLLLADTTSEFDEEWNTEFNEQFHMAIADGEGNVVKDLDEYLTKFGTVTGIDTRFSEPEYRDGILVLTLFVNDGQEDGQTGIIEVALDRDGNEIYSLGEWPGCSIQEYGGTNPWRYLNGLRNLGEDVGIVDGSGAVVYKNPDAKPVVIAGANSLAGTSFRNNEVYGLDGSLVLDVTSLSTEQYTFGQDAIKALAGDDVLWLTASEQNPHGGSSRTVTGLYNVASQEWVVPLSGGLVDVAPSFDGSLWVRVADKSVLDGSFSSTAEGNEYYSCILDSASGEVLFDLATEDLDDAATEFSAQYLHGGYWYVSGSKLASDLLVHIDEDGTYGGAQAIDFEPSLDYGQGIALLEN